MVQQLLCVKCGGVVPGPRSQAGQSVPPPTKKGIEILQAFRKGMRPDPRLRSALDRAIPFSQVSMCAAARQLVRAVTRVRQVATPSGSQPAEAEVQEAP
eukprot:2487156-Pyramimonas_sp.AAC.1